MEILLRRKVLRFLLEHPIISYNNAFDRGLDNATAIHKNRFTLPQLHTLCEKFRLITWITTEWSDRIEVVEALAMTCCRLAEPLRLLTVANEFGRSVESSSRVILAVVRMLYAKFADVLYLPETLTTERPGRKFIIQL
ncbi:hypothetical protein DYB26_015833 [Aphanomyces astaci]|uniref:DDE Tnp4 domain-containing protein n=1 Tax=Aphanomyces astaci TaxID=112090 RepID=A0A397EKT3_APHAT|nr:hypothetical protein DYB31_015960 [Aphanomyces astaci]RHZ07993.1 hypothetical protein DYB26_015833 [Aphanomyces astaci]